MKAHRRTHIRIYFALDVLIFASSILHLLHFQIFVHTIDNRKDVEYIYGKKTKKLQGKTVCAIDL